MTAILMPVEPQAETVYTFFRDLPSTWLVPAVSSLEHLTIYSNQPFGFYPRLDLREVHFPRLKTLSFGNYTFVHDSQLDWILSHGGTLTELYLDRCPILFEVAITDVNNTYLKADEFENTSRPELSGAPYASYRTRWCDYFRAFKDGLPRLRHFRYGRHPTWECNGNDLMPFEGETEIEIGLMNGSYFAHFNTLGQVTSLKEIDIDCIGYYRCFAWRWSITQRRGQGGFEGAICQNRAGCWSH